MRAGSFRLAVSGTYGSGKTTTSEALSVATGIPRTHALTAREILRDLLPGKQLEELAARELIMLGLRRLEERIHHEAAQPGSFVSDGSVIHEWIYGEIRMQVGINPGAGLVHRALNEVAGLPIKRFYRQYMGAYGRIVKDRAARLYDAYVHLPVEFPLKADGHRPVSERFRTKSDELLLATIDEIEVPYLIVRGTVEKRVHTIVEAFNLPLVVPVDEAVAVAVHRVSAASAVLESDAREHAARRATSPWRRVKHALRY